jgi:hypothetical protein
MVSRAVELAKDLLGAALGALLAGTARAQPAPPGVAGAQPLVYGPTGKIGFGDPPGPGGLGGSSSPPPGGTPLIDSSGNPLSDTSTEAVTSS